MKRLFAILALATVALAAAACSTTKADEPSGPVASGNASGPVVVAADMKFQTPDVVVPAGAAFELTFDNRDSAPHNVAIYTDSSASQALFKGEIFSAGSKVYEVPALAAGTYFFRCDVHPDMTGTIVAK